LGKLKLVSYAPQERKLVIVKVGTASVDKEKIEAALKNTYGKLGITYTIAVEEGFATNKEWDTDGVDGLKDTRTGTFSNNFTGEQKKIIEVYRAWAKKENKFDKNAAYLLYTNGASNNANLLGEMPRDKDGQFGFVFAGTATQEKINKTVAHELGHGVFTLEHAFDAKVGLPNEGDNLMDYSDKGTKLFKYQWDVIAKPGVVWGITEGDDDAALKETGGYILTKETTFLSPGNKLITLPKGTRIRILCIDMKSSFPNGYLYSFETPDKNKYCFKYKEFLYANTPQFSGYYKLKISDDSYSTEKYIDKTKHSVGKQKISFIHYNELIDDKHEYWFLDQEYNVEAKMISIDGTAAGEYDGIDVYYNKVKPTAEFIKGTYSYSSCNSDKKNKDKVDIKGGNYLLEVGKRTGNGYKPDSRNINENKSGVYDYADGLTQAEQREIEQDFVRMLTLTGMKGKVFVTDSKTPQDKKAEIKKYLAEIKGKNVGMLIDYDSEGNPTIEFGYDKEEVTRSGGIKVSNRFLVLLAKLAKELRLPEVNFNPITAILDGLAGLIGKAAIHERFYNPEHNDYNSVPYRIYKYSSGSFIKDAIKEKVLGKADKFKGSQLEFAYMCGLWNGLVAVIKGLPESASLIVKLITNEDETRTKLGDAISKLSWEKMKQLCSSEWDKFKNSNACVQSHASGKLTFDVVTIFIGFTKVGKAAGFINALDKLDAVGKSMELIFKACGKILKPVFKAGTKGLRFGLEVGWAFVKPGVRLSRGGRMYGMIIPIPPINLSANIEAAYKKIRELRNKNELEKYLKERENTLTLLTDENGADIIDDYGNRLAEIEIELPDGSKQKVQVLTNDADEYALEKAGRENGQLDDGVNGVGNLDFATMDLPGALQHVRYRDLADLARRDIVGLHDAIEFFKLRIKRAIGDINFRFPAGKTLDEVDEIVVLVDNIHPTTPGVRTIEYRVPSTDGKLVNNINGTNVNKGYTTGSTKGKNSTENFIKNIYDPAIWPEARLENALKEALEDSFKNKSLKDGLFDGLTKEGYSIQGYIRNGKVSTFYFN
jgi:hypothetical protein